MKRRRPNNNRRNWQWTFLAGLALILITGGFFRLLRVIEIQAFTIGGMSSQIQTITTEKGQLERVVDGMKIEYHSLLDQAGLPTPEKMARLIRYYFPEDPETAVAVAWSESRLWPDVQGWNCWYSKEGVLQERQKLPTDVSQGCKSKQDRAKSWSTDCGLMQINILGQKCPDELFNPEVNLKAAQEKHSRRGWQPWFGYTNGGYKAYLAKGNQ